MSSSAMDIVSSSSAHPATTSISQILTTVVLPRGQEGKKKNAPSKTTTTRTPSWKQVASIWGRASDQRDGDDDDGDGAHGDHIASAALGLKRNMWLSTDASSYPARILEQQKQPKKRVAPVRRGVSNARPSKRRRRLIAKRRGTKKNRAKLGNEQQRQPTAATRVEDRSNKNNKSGTTASLQKLHKRLKKHRMIRLMRQRRRRQQKGGHGRKAGTRSSSSTALLVLLRLRRYVRSLVEKREFLSNDLLPCARKYFKQLLSLGGENDHADDVQRQRLTAMLRGSSMCTLLGATVAVDASCLPGLTSNGQQQQQFVHGTVVDHVRGSSTALFAPPRSITVLVHGTCILVCLYPRSSGGGSKTTVCIRSSDQDDNGSSSTSSSSFSCALLVPYHQDALRIDLSTEVGSWVGMLTSANIFMMSNFPLNKQ